MTAVPSLTAKNKEISLCCMIFLACKRKCLIADDNCLEVKWESEITINRTFYPPHPFRFIRPKSRFSPGRLFPLTPLRFLNKQSRLPFHFQNFYCMRFKEPTSECEKKDLNKIIFSPNNNYSFFCYISTDKRQLIY